MHGSCRGVLPWGDGSSVLSLVVTDLTTSKVGSITGVEEDPRFAFIAKALYGIRYSKRGSAAVRQCNPHQKVGVGDLLNDMQSG